MSHPRDWMQVRPEGLYCAPADCFIDPMRPVHQAIITHGHADHARSGHGTVYATPQTMRIMRCRYGEEHAEHQQGVEYGETVDLPGGVRLTLIPAGHILGSAQAVLEYKDSRIIITGDYKRRADPTCEPFKAMPCDVLVSEATFGLPVFTHPPIEQETQKLLDSLALFADRTHLVGVYALGKCQRLMLALRALGYDKPIYIHGALMKLCELYEDEGIALGEFRKVPDLRDKEPLAGELVLCPPSALADRWSRRFANPVTAMASGWMTVRARARQRRAELPLIISDHADWSELLQTLQDVNPGELWVTHGREEALVYQARQMGYAAQALSLLGYEEESD